MPLASLTWHVPGCAAGMLTVKIADCQWPRRPHAVSLVMLAISLGSLQPPALGDDAILWIGGSSGPQWSTPANWSSGAEPNAASNLVFPTGSGAIQLSANEAAASLLFQDSYTLSGGSLTLSSGGITVAGTSVATIDSVLKAPSGIVKLGSGTLSLAGVNLDVPVAVLEGTLELNRNGFLPAITGIQSVAAGATVRFTGSGGNQIDNGAVSRVTPTGGMQGLDGTVDFIGHSATVPYLMGSSSGLVTNSSFTPAVLTIANAQGISAPAQLYAGAINDGAGSMALIISGPDARVTLTGASNFSGQTQILDGATLSVSSLNRVVGGSSTSSLGAPTSVANGTILLGNNSQPAQLRYIGSGETSDRRIALGGTTGDGIITASGTGALTLAGDITATQSGAKQLILSGSNAGSNTLSGAISDGSGTVGLVKQGPGSWTLTGNNTFSGDTFVSGGELRAGATGALGSGNSGTAHVAVNNSGTLILSGSSADRIRDDASLALGSGGTLRLEAELGGLSERVGALTLAAGSTIDFDNAADGFGFSLFLNVLNLAVGGSTVVQNWNTDLGTGTADRIFMESLPAGYSVGATTGALLFNLDGSYYPATFVASGSRYEAVATLVAVPEPSTLVSALFVVAGTLWHDRRRHRSAS